MSRHIFKIAQRKKARVEVKERRKAMMREMRARRVMDASKE